jgi:Tetracyclin repressor-like, C-terminal domain
MAWGLLVDYTIGFAIDGPPAAVNEHRRRDPATRARLQRFLGSLPPDRFPALVALADQLWVDNREERFSAGLQVLIDGLEHARTPDRPALGRRAAIGPQAAQQAVDE